MMLRLGYAGQTLFSVVCPEWKEWEPSRPDVTLKYEYRVKPKGGNRAMLFYYGDNSLSTQSMFPVGNIMQGLKNEVELYIVDSIGDYMRVIYVVTVLSLRFS